jgi:hypothetical protein
LEEELERIETWRRTRETRDFEKEQENLETACDEEEFRK